VFATEAMRRAQNASEMLEAIRSMTPDLVVHILAPQVETLFGAVGARSGFVDVGGLFLDLGGGSVQMTYMDTSGIQKLGSNEQVGYEVSAALAGESLPFGAARLIKILEGADPETQALEISKLKTGMVEAFANLRKVFPSLSDAISAAQQAHTTEGNESDTGIDVYLCGGGFRGYGSMLMHNDPIQPYPMSSIGSYVVSGKLFSRTKEMLEINNMFKGKIFGLSKRRRAQFPAIVTVVQALIEAVPHIRSVTFCAGGNREGALMMMLPREIRESNPLSHLHTHTEPLLSLKYSTENSVLHDVMDAISSALPENVDHAPMTVFSLHLGALYTSQVWTHVGDDADANASASLHDAISHNPGCPGLTHLARAVLGLTRCARWGAYLGPADQQLYQSLRTLVTRADPRALFWIDYIGAITAVLASVVTCWPRNQGAIQNTIRCVQP